ncbi:MAG: AraC family transcriptional regulator [Hyphomonas sp.]
MNQLISLASQTLDHLPEGARLAWHRHRAPYVAVVLRGNLEEVGEQGRRNLGPGSVIVHDPFEAHSDRVIGAGVDILNIALDREGVLPARASVLKDIDGLVRIVEFDPKHVLEWIAPRLENAPCEILEWPDQLARDMLHDTGLNLRQWADHTGLRVETISRGFRNAFGLSPKQFRASVRARKAWKAIVNCEASLSDIAYSSGFSDQAHMSRAVKQLTGYPPGHWGGSTGFKTPAASRVSLTS